MTCKFILLRAIEALVRLWQGIAWRIHSSNLERGRYKALDNLEVSMEAQEATRELEGLMNELGDEE